MCKACGVMWTRIHISQLFYLSQNGAGSALCVGLLLFIQRTGKKRGRQMRGDTWEDSGRITPKTGDTLCSNKTSSGLCSLVKEMLVLSGESVAGIHFILLGFDSSRGVCASVCVIIFHTLQSDHTLSLYRRRRRILTWMTSSVEDECPTKGNPPQVSLRHNVTRIKDPTRCSCSVFFQHLLIATYRLTSRSLCTFIRELWTSPHG